MAAIAGQESYFHVLQLWIDYWQLILIVSFALILSKAYFNRGLNRYPGPFLGQLHQCLAGLGRPKNQHQHTMIALHEKDGSVVRIGPNTVDISDAKYVPEIYGLKNGFTKVSHISTLTFTGSHPLLVSWTH
jgi:hypothetical protein